MLKLAIFGAPVAHSRSPELHQAFARQANLSIDYQKMAVTGDFSRAVQAFIATGAIGFNITSPCKEQAFQLASNHSIRAKQAEAVNTVLVDETGQCYGDNTDGAGFVRDLTVNKGFTLKGKNIVIHGAGGAVRGLLPALLAESPQQLWLINRTYAKALVLSTNFNQLGPVIAVPYGTCLTAIDLLIDGSSLACQDFSGLAAIHFNESALAYDLKYSHVATAFMTWAKAQGCQQCTDGFGMLVEQAALSFFLWTGFTPQTQSLLRL